MPKAIILHKPGAPEKFSFEEVKVPAPKAGEARIRHTAIGVNYIDTYFRTALYPWPHEAPMIVGAEGAGVVLELGPEVAHLQVGDRVAYTASVGGYSEERIIDASRLVKIPAGVSDELAAASMLKGMTAHYLLHRTFALKPGHTALFHAAAGGVGLIAGQWGAHLGATMIGTAGSAEKISLAQNNGYQHMINYRKENFVERVKEITNGEGVDVVYDSVGQDTYPHSLDCLKRLGMWVSFGQSSGMVKDFELHHLAQRGSLFATRPSLFAYTATRAELEATANALFEALGQGIVKVSINQRYPLAEAAEVHRLLQSRQTTGSTILLP
jgi:NADPH2:quinone reductase